MTSNEIGELLDVRAAAAFLGRTERAIRKDIERRRLPFRRHGARILFVRSELTTFLAALDGVSVEEAVANVRNGAGGDQSFSRPRELLDEIEEEHDHDEQRYASVKHDLIGKAPVRGSFGAKTRSRMIRATA